MRITKLKVGKDSGLTVVYEEPGKNKGDTRLVTFTSGDDPHPDLVHAFGEVRSCVLHRLKLTKLSDDSALTGITLKDDDDGTCFTATLLVQRDGYNAPLVLNSPFLAGGELNDAESHALSRLQVETAAYIGGKRAQADLFEAA